MYDASCTGRVKVQNLTFAKNDFTSTSGGNYNGLPVTDQSVLYIATDTFYEVAVPQFANAVPARVPVPNAFCKVSTNCGWTSLNLADGEVSNRMLFIDYLKSFATVTPAVDGRMTNSAVGCI